MYKFLFLFIAFAVLSCSSTSTPPTVANDTVSDTTSSTPEVSSSEEITDKSTLEGFWRSLKTAILNHDIAAIKTHYTAEARVYKFQAPYYQEKIAAMETSDWEKSQEIHGDTPVYELRLVFPEEGLSELDYPATTIYIQQNSNNIFEIFSVIEAG